jgi:hypothetical protein
MGWKQISPFYGQNVRVVGPSGSSASYIGARGIQGAVEEIKDSSATKQYTVLLNPGVYTPGAAAADELRLDGLSNTKKYINLIGLDRDACIISRPNSPGVGNSIIVPSDFCRVSNLTLDSPVSRVMHWDRTAGSILSVDNVHFRQGGSGVGISSGVTSTGSRMEVTNCLFNTDISIHNGSLGTSADFAEIIISGNTFYRATGNAIGFDMTIGPSSMRVYLTGNNGRYWEVDPSHEINIKKTEDATASLLLFIDSSAGFWLRNESAVKNKFWNEIIFPQYHRYTAITAVNAEADIVVVTPGLPVANGQVIERTTTANAQWPAVVTAIASTSLTYSPRLATGPYAEVMCTTGAVAVGDILCTSTTTGRAVTNNAQTDPTRILGWAYGSKSGGAEGRVVVKLNRSINCW